MERKLQKTKVEEWLDNPKRVLVGGLVVGIGGFLTYKLVRKIITNNRKKNTSLQADNDLEVQQAMLLRNAMNPSGISWMMSFDTTNNDAIVALAKKITNFDKVATSYRKLYDSDLTVDLQSELTTDEYKKFLTLIAMSAPASSGTTTSNSAITTNAVFATKGQMIVAKKEVFLRSSADASYHGAFYETSKNNIISKVKAGEFVGYATGKQEYDTVNDVKFIQAGFVFLKKDLPDLFKSFAGKKYTFWVSSSSDYIDKFDYFKHMFTKYPSLATIVKYKKPLDYYDTEVSGLSNRLVVSLKDMQVLDNKMQPYVNVERQTLLGEYLGELNTPKNRYIKFRTIDNTERWADASNIKIIER